MTVLGQKQNETETKTPNGVPTRQIGKKDGYAVPFPAFFLVAISLKVTAYEQQRRTQKESKKQKTDTHQVDYLPKEKKNKGGRIYTGR